MDSSVIQNQQASSIENMQIKIPDFFESGSQYIPIGKQTDVNGKSAPAIPDFAKLPTDGNYIVVVIGGELQFVKANSGSLQLFNNNLGWTDTESCE
jgi:hypothetical protein